MSMIFDPSQPDLRKVLKEHEELALRYIWEVGEKGANSRQTWEAVNNRLEEIRSISRASVINFLNRMVDQRVLGFRDATGKGGHHRVYYPLMDEEDYKRSVAKTILESLMRDFPEETREVLTEF